MFARTDVITERAVDQAPGFGFLFRVQSARTEQAINRISGLQHFKLAIRIGPSVFDSVWQQHRTRRAQRDQAMLVERQEAGLLVELFEFRIEPVWEARVNSLDRFADLSAAR